MSRDAAYVDTASVDDEASGDSGSQGSGSMESRTADPEGPVRFSDLVHLPRTA